MIFRSVAATDMNGKASVPVVVVARRTVMRTADGDVARAPDGVAVVVVIYHIAFAPNGTMIVMMMCYICPDGSMMAAVVAASFRIRSDDERAEADGQNCEKFFHIG